MEGLIKKIKDKINKISKKWDIYIESKEKSEIIVNDGRAEKVKKSEVKGIAIRVFKNNKVAFISGLAGNCNIDNLIFKLKDSLYVEGYEMHRFFKNEKTNSNLKIFDSDIKKETLKRKIKKLIEIEKYTKSLNKKIKYVRDIGYFENIDNVFYLNSEGFKGLYEKTYLYAFLSVIAGDNKNDGVVVDGIKSSVKVKGINLKNLGEKTAEKAVNLIKAKSVSSGRYDIILPNYVSSEFISYIAPLFYAENIRKKKSLFWQCKKGEKILSDNITIRDDACLNWQTGSYPFDGEGNCSFDKVVIQKGLLMDFLYDNLNAVYFNENKICNSIRKDFQKLPECGVSNFYIEKGDSGLNEILKNFSGIFVNSIMGGHTIDTVSGNFSLGINGWLYKNGSVIQPIKETLMTGNLKELFYNIASVCDDIEFYFNYGSPSLLVKDILISGKE